MFFSASKIIWFFLTPSNLLVALLLIGVLLRRRRLMLVSLALLVIAAFSPLGNLLLLPLEDRFPPWELSSRSPAGIIVLGGSQITATTIARGQISLNESAERMTEAAMLARRYPLAKLVFTGGDGGILGGAGVEADDAKELFLRLGVPSSQLILERASRNTYENAGLVAKAVQPKAGEVWLLVTSAAHMPRAVGAFRKAGVYVTPYPVDYRTRGGNDALKPFFSAAEGLARTDGAVHEWLGLVTYWALGYTNELLPKP
jgi:uncharacterized SAM-binding protein YcdF (DUF218 family)